MNIPPSAASVSRSRLPLSATGRRLLWLSVVLGLGFVLPALLAPWLAPHNPLALDLTGSLERPTWAYPLGRDEQGADILSRLIHGARISLVVGLSSVAASTLVGVTLGLVAGFLGGWVENLLMRLVDVLLAFPGLLLAIALVAVLGPGLGNVVIALSVLGWTGFARLVRAQVLSVRERDFVLAARSLGAGPWRLMVRHILPNITAPVLVQASFSVAGAILAEASLSFLGLGAPPGTPSWGAMLAEGKNVLMEAPHVSLAPGAAIMAVVLGFNLIGDALADHLDPRRRES
ncbi:MAG: ABC transporter permease [Deltaproteobacteria bacterium]|nr:ABC transporter permease [Deltaproteobacteria bacterium]